ncbi:hypothetical protein HGM15179_008452 [Zosterops borbonicus]|uniref:Uncharacterized protein n=1 Tax=Zosterops borbonicus TaxID=364589 RepID=A0A8K1GJ23_9PASS|nr:hypothetical protein HGM15179_008452 [Zosterops borbonicus]
MGDFNSPEINWEHHTAGKIGARIFLKNLDDDFIEEVIKEMTWKDALLDLLLPNRVDLMSGVEIGGCLGHSNLEVINIKIPVDRRKSACKTSALDMRKADFRLLKKLVNEGQKEFQCPELEDCDCENGQFQVNCETVQVLLL